MALHYFGLTIVCLMGGKDILGCTDGSSVGAIPVFENRYKSGREPAFSGMDDGMRSISKQRIIKLADMGTAATFW